MQIFLKKWIDSIFTDQFIFKISFLLRNADFFINFVNSNLKKTSYFTSEIMIRFLNLYDNLFQLRFPLREFLRKCFRDTILDFIKKIENKYLESKCLMFINYMIQKKKNDKFNKRFNFLFFSKDLLILNYRFKKNLNLHRELNKFLFSKENVSKKFKFNVNTSFKSWFRTVKFYLYDVVIYP